MSTFAVIATGESLNPDPLAAAERVRHLRCIAVNDAFRIAPWAEVLVACDGKWWRANPDALAFAGDKMCANATPPGVFPIAPPPTSGTSCNSGLLGLEQAVRRGAKRVLLLGIDLCGTHYFGQHLTLENTQPGRFRIFLMQFEKYARTLNGVEVINCSSNSALTCFPKMTLDAALENELSCA